MKVLLASVALALLAAPAAAQTRFTVSRPPAGAKFVVVPADADDEAPRLTYKEAYELSVKTGKPLVIWVGGNFCPECVRAESVDFVHYFTDFFPEITAPAIVVGLPGSGGVERVGDITSWPAGHIATVRQTIRDFRERRVIRRDVVPYRGGAFAAPAAWPAAPPAVLQFQSYAPAGYGGYGGMRMGMRMGRGRAGGC